MPIGANTKHYKLEKIGDNYITFGYNGGINTFKYSQEIRNKKIFKTQLEEDMEKSLEYGNMAPLALFAFQLKRGYRMAYDYIVLKSFQMRRRTITLKVSFNKKSITIMFADLKIRLMRCEITDPDELLRIAEKDIEIKKRIIAGKLIFITFYGEHHMFIKETADYKILRRSVDKDKYDRFKKDYYYCDKLSDLDPRYVNKFKELYEVITTYLQKKIGTDANLYRFYDAIADLTNLFLCKNDKAYVVFRRNENIFISLFKKSGKIVRERLNYCDIAAFKEGNGDLSLMVTFSRDVINKYDHFIIYKKTTLEEIAEYLSAPELDITEVFGLKEVNRNDKEIIFEIDGEDAFMSLTAE